MSYILPIEDDSLVIPPTLESLTLLSDKYFVARREKYCKSLPTLQKKLNLCIKAAASNGLNATVCYVGDMEGDLKYHKEMLKASYMKQGYAIDITPSCIYISWY